MTRIGLVLVLVQVFLSCPQSRATADFTAVPLGYPVANWSLVDTDGDGSRELAITIDGTPTRVGVFDPLTLSWRDGPRELPVSLWGWTVVGSVAEGGILYYYLSGSDLRCFDVSNAKDTLLWSVPYAPRDLCALPVGSNGSQLLGVGRAITTPLPGCGGPGPSCCGSSYGWLIEIRDPLSGDSVATINGGPWLPAELPPCGGLVPAQILALQSNWLLYFCSGFGFEGQSARRLNLVDADGSISDSSKSVSQASPRAGAGIVHTWVVSAMGRVCPENAGGITHYTMSGPLGYSGANPFDTNSYLPLVVEAYRDSFSSPTWTLLDSDKRKYRDIIDYDVDHDGTSEFVLPLGRLSSWEVRDMLDGAVLDTIAQRPSVDLFKLFVLTYTEQKLCYINGSTLYVYDADIPTGVFDDPDSPTSVPREFTVVAYPNPFNSAVVLTWPADADASSLMIFNVLGQAVWNSDVIGSHAIWEGYDFRGSRCPSGIYFARLASSVSTATIKIVLLR